jgi:hypothetical protein
MQVPAFDDMEELRHAVANPPINPAQVCSQLWQLINNGTFDHHVTEDVLRGLQSCIQMERLRNDDLLAYLHAQVDQVQWNLRLLQDMRDYLRQLQGNPFEGLVTEMMEANATEPEDELPH